MYAYIEYFIYSIILFYLETCYLRACAWEVTKEDSEFGNYTKSYYCYYTFVYDSLIYQAIIVALCTLIVYMIFFEESKKVVEMKEENIRLHRELADKEKIILSLITYNFTDDTHKKIISFLNTYNFTNDTRDYILNTDNISKVIEEFELLGLF